MHHRIGAVLAMSAAMMPSSTYVSSFGRLHHHHRRRFTTTMMVAPMEYIQLGDSDLKISKVTLGTMTWGNQNTEEEGMAQMDTAFKEYGVNILDSAELYPVPMNAQTQGATDRIVGKWLKTMDRSKVIVASKVCGYSTMKYMPGRNGQACRLTRDQIVASVDASLKRLGTSYIDLLQLHWPDRYVSMFGGAPYDLRQERDYVSFEEQLRALDELVKAGKVRYVGVSNETPYGVMRFAQAARDYGLPKIVSIQNSYSVLVRADYEAGLVETCSPRHENVGLLAYSPLCGGLLTGKYRDPEKSKKARLNIFEGYMERYKQSLARDAVDAYCAVADKHGLTPTALALGWAFNQPHVASTIIGATTQEQLRENLNAWGERTKITDDVVADIAAVYKQYRDPSRA